MGREGNGIAVKIAVGTGRLYQVVSRFTNGKASGRHCLGLGMGKEARGVKA